MTMNDNTLYTWTIYKKGIEPFPSNHIARCHKVADGKVTLLKDEYMVAHDIDLIRSELRRRGLTLVGRTPEDDEAIIETWI